MVVGRGDGLVEGLKERLALITGLSINSQGDIMLFRKPGDANHPALSNDARAPKLPITCTLWSNLPHGIRGPLLKKDTTWPYGSRQVRRRAMFLMYYRQISIYNLPRKNRRLMAKSRMHQVYAGISAEMQAENVKLVKPAERISWYSHAIKVAKELFAQ